jgi:hypothetical protein
MKLRKNQSKKKDTIKRSKSTRVNSQSHDPNHETKSVFDSVVAGAFQITFHAKMHVNDVFSFLKNHF